MLKQNNTIYYDFQNNYENISDITTLFENKRSELVLSNYLNTLVFAIDNLQDSTYAIAIPIISCSEITNSFAICKIFTDTDYKIVLRETIYDLSCIDNMSFINFEFTPINIKKNKTVYCKIILYTPTPVISVYCRRFSFKDKLYKKFFKNYKYNPYYIASIKV